MKTQEEIARLEEENQKLRNRIAELELAKSRGKGRSLGEAGLAILKAEGAVPLSRFAGMTKNPADVVYHVRHSLKIPVATIRTEQGTVYVLQDQLKTSSEDKEAERRAAA